MTRQSEKTQEERIIAREFAIELVDMANLNNEALELAQARAKAVQDRIIAERERTKKKPFWKRTQEEKKHAKRIAQANENLESAEGQ